MEEQNRGGSALLNTLNADQKRALENVRAAAERIWARPLHRYYTDHTVAHSERVVVLLDGLAAGVMATEKRLAPTEVFVLLATAYLHDIGMQDERFAGGDLEKIRAAHHEVTAELIYRAAQDPAAAVNLGLPDDPGLVEAVALVTKGHRKVDLRSAEYDVLVHGGETLRLRLLAALLRFADELDIDHRRVDLEQMKLLNLPLESQLHWWKCHYVSGVSIADEYIRIAYRLPETRSDYESLIVPLVESDVRARLTDLEEIFRADAVKVALGKSQVRAMRLVQPLPPEVEKYATAQVRGAQGVDAPVGVKKPATRGVGRGAGSVQDYVEAMDDFVNGLDPLKYGVERRQTGKITTYIFRSERAEIGRMSIKPGPLWSAAPVYIRVHLTAASRGADIAFENLGSVSIPDWPEAEQKRAREFVHLWHSAEAHFDLWFGTGMWAEATRSTGRRTEQTEPTRTVLDQRGQTVGTQINVVGDYIDRHATVSDRGTGATELAQSPEYPSPPELDRFTKEDFAKLEDALHYVWVSVSGRSLDVKWSATSNWNTITSRFPDIPKSIRNTFDEIMRTRELARGGPLDLDMKQLSAARRGIDQILSFLQERFPNAGVELPPGSMKPATLEETSAHTTGPDPAIVRIYSAGGGVVGAGFLAGERQVLTCAHVVDDALGRARGTPEMPQVGASLDFPLVAAGQRLAARVTAWQPQADVAGLELEEPPPTGAAPAVLVSAGDLWGHSFRAFGFPQGYENGVWASGRILGREATGWVQVEDLKQTGYFVALGFSGRPVWDEALEGVVGVVVAAERQPGVRAAFLIPADALKEAWPALIVSRRAAPSATPAPPAAADISVLRARLQRLDAVEIESLCLDHFPAVADKFGRGLRRDEMLNLLLDHCRHNPEDAARLAGLLKRGDR